MFTLVGGVWVRLIWSSSSLQKLEEQDRKALNMKEQLQREHRYLKRRLEQLSVSGSVERIRTDSMGSTISTDSEQGSLSLVNCISGTHTKPTIV